MNGVFLTRRFYIDMVLRLRQLGLFYLSIMELNKQIKYYKKLTKEIFTQPLARRKNGDIIEKQADSGQIVIENNKNRNKPI